MPTAHRHLWILASFASPALQIIQILITFSPTIGKGSFPKTSASLASSTQKPCIICIICIKNTPNFATFAPPPFGSSPPPNFKFPLPQICPPTASPPTPPNTHFVRWSDLQPSLRLAFVIYILFQLLSKKDWDLLKDLLIGSWLTNAFSGPKETPCVWSFADLWSIGPCSLVKQNPLLWPG